MLDRLTLLGAQPKSERFVKDGKIVTAAGVSAGTDMALFLSGLIADEEYARMLQLVVEYYPEPPLDFRSEQEFLRILKLPQGNF